LFHPFNGGGGGYTPLLSNSSKNRRKQTHLNFVIYQNGPVYSQKWEIFQFSFDKIDVRLSLTSLLAMPQKENPIPGSVVMNKFFLNFFCRREKADAF